MDVKLYYIEGISRSDTPYFFSNGQQATLAKQVSYFNTHLVRTVSTSFYPPHYENEIKFETDDVDFTDSVNYLSLTYGGKTYYYFIDAIEYVNEGIIILYITMDVIQTYMFDIRIASAIIERKFINRWNSTAISRGYLRENVSRGNKIQTNYVVYEHAYENGMLFIQHTNGEYTHWSSYMFNDSAFPHATIATIPATLWIAPYPGGNLVSNGTTYTNLSATELLRNFGDNADAWEAYIIPFNPFNNLRVSENVYYSDDGTWTPLVNGANVQKGGIKQGVAGQTAQTDSYEIKSYSKNYLFAFEKNVTLELPFSTYFEPCLIDENYISYYFGSRATPTSYPLHKLTGIRVHNHYYADIFSGNRYYCITDESDVDTYRTCTIDANNIGVPLLNDNWKSYIANNKGRWVSAGIQSGVNLIEAIATYGGSTYGAIGKDITKVNDVKYAHLARNKKGQFTKKLSRIGSTTTTKSRTVFGQIPSGNSGDWASDMFSTAMPLLNQAVTDYNQKFAPDSIKGTYNIGDILSYNYDIVAWVEIVDDLDACAQYFHRNGYLVNEYVTNINDIFNYVMNRYYYNIVKLSLPEVHLHNVIEDQDTINEIKDRLEAGVRLWRVAADTHSYSEWVDPTLRTLSTTYVVTIPYLVNTLFGGTATLISGTGAADVVIDNISHSTVTFHLSGGGTNPQFKITFTGVFSSLDLPVSIGDFTYDNVELDYL